VAEGARAGADVAVGPESKPLQLAVVSPRQVPTDRLVSADTRGGESTASRPIGAAKLA
jgi:hypothetical protein